MKFRPLHDRVVVKRIEAEEKTAGGIIIPDSAKETPSQGEITAVGPGGRDEAGKLIPIDLKVGDRVFCSASGQATRSSLMVRTF
ncbi:co-chaperonin GroES (HSP10) [Bradyrhizobium japonicum]|nr:chaperonin GroES [Bradyrhizobium japonicum]MCP1782480.1 chaperonin GroES [Bradyrhizobium japonicum]MCP1861906.1 chaperonin GroES [Bradyrhizobium japonicum]MCP1892662.1 chaperonin GroES [Bradyrhizobium japonicum]MCP1965230.1 chaperonin GroES [Bradyrhizobium japonicum]